MPDHAPVQRQSVDVEPYILAKDVITTVFQFTAAIVLSRSLCKCKLTKKHNLKSNSLFSKKLGLCAALKMVVDAVAAVAGNITMNIPHKIHINRCQTHTSEAVDDKFVIQKIFQARNKTIQLFNEIKSNLHEGMNELEARKLALKISKDFGVTKHWHQPYIRFGSGTALSFHDPLQAGNIFLVNQPYYIDLGPVWEDANTGLEYEGDYGDTFVLGENADAEKCIQLAHRLFSEAKDRWIKEQLSGKQLYQFIKNEVELNNFKLMEDFDGHRISDFPHHKYTQDRLTQIPFTPTPSFWILELQINDSQNRFGAFFEDIL